jgi:hypothetical protein
MLRPTLLHLAPHSGRSCTGQIRAGQTVRTAKTLRSVPSSARSLSIEAPRGINLVIRWIREAVALHLVPDGNRQDVRRLGGAWLAKHRRPMSLAELLPQLVGLSTK